MLDVIQDIKDDLTSNVKTKKQENHHEENNSAIPTTICLDEKEIPTPLSSCTESSNSVASEDRYCSITFPREEENFKQVDSISELLPQNKFSTACASTVSGRELVAESSSVGENVEAATQEGYEIDLAEIKEQLNSSEVFAETMTGIIPVQEPELQVCPVTEPLPAKKYQDTETNVTEIMPEDTYECETKCSRLPSTDPVILNTEEESNPEIDVSNEISSDALTGTATELMPDEQHASEITFTSSSSMSIEQTLNEAFLEILGKKEAISNEIHSASNSLCDIEGSAIEMESKDVESSPVMPASESIDITVSNEECALFVSESQTQFLKILDPQTSVENLTSDIFSEVKGQIQQDGSVKQRKPLSGNIFAEITEACEEKFVHAMKSVSERSVNMEVSSTMNDTLKEVGRIKDAAQDVVKMISQFTENILCHYLMNKMPANEATENSFPCEESVKSSIKSLSSQIVSHIVHKTSTERILEFDKERFSVSGSSSDISESQSSDVLSPVLHGIFYNTSQNNTDQSESDSDEGPTEVVNTGGQAEHNVTISGKTISKTKKRYLRKATTSKERFLHETESDQQFPCSTVSEEVIAETETPHTSTLELLTLAETKTPSESETGSDHTIISENFQSNPVTNKSFLEENDVSVIDISNIHLDEVASDRFGNESFDNLVQVVKDTLDQLCHGRTEMSETNQKVKIDLLCKGTKERSDDHLVDEILSRIFNFTTATAEKEYSSDLNTVDPGASGRAGCVDAEKCENELYAETRVQIPNSCEINATGDVQEPQSKKEVRTIQSEATFENQPLVDTGVQFPSSCGINTTSDIQEPQSDKEIQTIQSELTLETQPPVDTGFQFPSSSELITAKLKEQQSEKEIQTMQSEVTLQSKPHIDKEVQFPSSCGITTPKIKEQQSDKEIQTIQSELVLENKPLVNTGVQFPSSREINSTKMKEQNEKEMQTTQSEVTFENKHLVDTGFQFPSSCKITATSDNEEQQNEEEIQAQSELANERQVLVDTELQFPSSCEIATTNNVKEQLSQTEIQIIESKLTWENQPLVGTRVQFPSSYGITTPEIEEQRSDKEIQTTQSEVILENKPHFDTGVQFPSSCRIIATSDNEEQQRDKEIHTIQSNLPQERQVLVDAGVQIPSSCGITTTNVTKEQLSQKEIQTIESEVSLENQPHVDIAVQTSCSSGIANTGDSKEQQRKVDAQTVQSEPTLENQALGDTEKHSMQSMEPDSNFGGNSFTKLDQNSSIEKQDNLMELSVHEMRDVISEIVKKLLDEYYLTTLDEVTDIQSEQNTTVPGASCSEPENVGCIKSQQSENSISVEEVCPLEEARYSSMDTNNTKSEVTSSSCTLVPTLFTPTFIREEGTINETRSEDLVTSLYSETEPESVTSMEIKFGSLEEACGVNRKDDCNIVTLTDCGVNVIDEKTKPIPIHAHVQDIEPKELPEMSSLVRIDEVPVHMSIQEANNVHNWLENISDCYPTSIHNTPSESMNSIGLESKELPEINSLVRIDETQVQMSMKGGDEKKRSSNDSRSETSCHQMLMQNTASGSIQMLMQDTSESIQPTSLEPKEVPEANSFVRKDEVPVQISIRANNDKNHSSNESGSETSCYHMLMQNSATENTTTNPKTNLQDILEDKLGDKARVSSVSAEALNAVAEKATSTSDRSRERILNMTARSFVNNVLLNVKQTLAHVDRKEILYKVNQIEDVLQDSLSSAEEIKSDVRYLKDEVSNIATMIRTLMIHIEDSHKEDVTVEKSAESEEATNEELWKEHHEEDEKEGTDSLLNAVETELLCRGIDVNQSVNATDDLHLDSDHQAMFLMTAVAAIAVAFILESHTTSKKENEVNVTQTQSLCNTKTTEPSSISYHAPSLDSVRADEKRISSGSSFDIEPFIYEILLEAANSIMDTTLKESASQIVCDTAELLGMFSPKLSNNQSADQVEHSDFLSSSPCETEPLPTPCPKIEDVSKTKSEESTRSSHQTLHEDKLQYMEVKDELKTSSSSMQCGSSEKEMLSGVEGEQLKLHETKDKEELTEIIHGRSLEKVTDIIASEGKESTSKIVGDTAEMLEVFSPVEHSGISSSSSCEKESLLTPNPEIEDTLKAKSTESTQDKLEHMDVTDELKTRNASMQCTSCEEKSPEEESKLLHETDMEDKDNGELKEIIPGRSLEKVIEIIASEVFNTTIAFLDNMADDEFDQTYNYVATYNRSSTSSNVSSELNERFGAIKTQVTNLVEDRVKDYMRNVNRKQPIKSQNKFSSAALDMKEIPPTVQHIYSDNDLESLKPRQNSLFKETVKGSSKTEGTEREISVDRPGETVVRKPLAGSTEEGEMQKPVSNLKKDLADKIIGRAMNMIYTSGDTSRSPEARNIVGSSLGNKSEESLDQSTTGDKWKNTHKATKVITIEDMTLTVQKLVKEQLQEMNTPNTTSIKEAFHLETACSRKDPSPCSSTGLKQRITPNLSGDLIHHVTTPSGGLPYFKKVPEVLLILNHMANFIFNGTEDSSCTEIDSQDAADPKRLSEQVLAIAKEKQKLFMKKLLLCKFVDDILHYQVDAVLLGKMGQSFLPRTMFTGTTAIGTQTSLDFKEYGTQTEHQELPRVSSNEMVDIIKLTTALKSDSFLLEGKMSSSTGKLRFVGTTDSDLLIKFITDLVDEAADHLAREKTNRFNY